MLLDSPLKKLIINHVQATLILAKFFFQTKHFEQTQRAVKVYVCDMIFAGALPPFSRTAVWEIPTAEAAEAAKAFNTQQTVI